jgi:hypothetical protein
VSTTGATLHGSLNPRGAATSYQFEFGTTTAYGSATPLTTGGAANRPADVSAAVSGLAQGTIHHYRLVAVRGAQRFPGPDATFTTAGTPATGGTVVAPKRPSLKQRARRARVTCTRVRRAFRCRVTRAGTLRVRLTMRKGKRIVARGRGKAGKRITLRGARAKPGRYKVTVTLFERGRRASATKRVRVR